MHAKLAPIAKAAFAWICMIDEFPRSRNFFASAATSAFMPWTSVARGHRYGLIAEALPSRTKLTKLRIVKEQSEGNQEARDQQRRERLQKVDEDCGLAASQQGLESGQREDEKQHRKLVGHVARLAPWI
jgi:hypothetical protein